MGQVDYDPILGRWRPHFTIEEEVLLTLYRRPKGTYPVEIRVVRWKLGGRYSPARLELRHKVFNREGKEINGRVQGFTLWELQEVIAPNIERIVQVMQKADLSNLHLKKFKPLKDKDL